MPKTQDRPSVSRSVAYSDITAVSQATPTDEPQQLSSLIDNLIAFTPSLQSETAD